jgi:hypothetical protein
MRCALAVCLACLLSGLFWGQAAPSSSTDYRPGAWAPASPLLTPAPPMLSDPSSTLSGASSELESTADRLDRLFAGLRASLLAAGISLASSDASLESSVISATNGINSLAGLRVDLAAADRLARRRSLESGLWRVGALSGVGACLGSIVWKGDPKAAGIGAIPGAVAGGVWMLAERWPPWIK